MTSTSTSTSTRSVAVVLTSVAALGCGPAAPPPNVGASEAPPTATREAPVGEASTSTTSGDRAPDEVGLASWYGSAFAGRRTASGERFDPSQLTAAHKRLPFGTWVEVRRVDNGRTVRVRVTDRGPNGHAANRIIDLSRRAAEELDMVRSGVVRVELRVVR